MKKIILLFAFNLLIFSCNTDEKVNPNISKVVNDYLIEMIDIMKKIQ